MKSEEMRYVRVTVPWYPTHPQDAKKPASRDWPRPRDPWGKGWLWQAPCGLGRSWPQTQWSMEIRVDAPRRMTGG